MTRVVIAATVALLGAVLIALGVLNVPFDWASFYVLSLLCAYCAVSVMTPGRAA